MKIGLNVALALVPKDVNGITKAVNIAGVSGVELPNKVQALWVVHAIMADGVLVFVHHTVANDFS